MVDYARYLVDPTRQSQQTMNNILGVMAFRENKRKNDLSRQLIEQQGEEDSLENLRWKTEQFIKLAELKDPEAMKAGMALAGIEGVNYEPTGDVIEFVGPKGNRFSGPREKLVEFSKHIYGGNLDAAQEYLNNPLNKILIDPPDPLEPPKNMNEALAQSIRGLPADQQTPENIIEQMGEFRSAGRDDRTNLEKNLEGAGLTPDTPEYQAELLKAVQKPTSTTNVTNNLPGSGDNALIKKVVNSLPEQQENARSGVKHIKRMNTILDIIDKQGDSVLGLSGAIKRALAPYAAAVGLDTDQMTDAQIFDTLVRTGAGSLRLEVVGPGPVSEYEQKILDAVSGRKMATTDGIKAIIEYNLSNKETDIQDYNEAVKTLSETPGYENTPKFFKPIDYKKGNPSSSGPIKTADAYMKKLQGKQ